MVALYNMAFVCMMDAVQGPLVSMMYQIVIDMRFFLYVLAISVSAFGTCLYLLFKVDMEENPFPDVKIKEE